MLRIGFPSARCFAALAGLVLFVPLGSAEENRIDEYQASTVMHHEIAGHLTGSAEAEYHQSSDHNSRATVIGWPVLVYTMNHWLQVSGGLRSVHTDNSTTADVLELRPYAGAKVMVKDLRKWRYYNYTRYEYRYLRNENSDSVTQYGRLRSRFAVEIPFASTLKAWKPKTWYAMADVEPYYRFDKGTVDPVLLRGGLGYVVSDQIQAELIYQAQFAHASSGGSRELNSNIIQFNVKIGLQAGLLRRLHNMTHAH